MSVVTDILKRYDISDDKCKKFEAFGEILKLTNKSFNLTRITDDESMAMLHFVDSISPALLGLIPGGAKVIDVGTGGGFPAVPLAIFTDAEITAVEASEKKLGFVKKVSDELGLNIQCICARAEELGHTDKRESFDICVSRAVANMSMLLELLSPFAKVGGKLLCYKGQNCLEEIELSKYAPKKLMLSEPKIHPAGVEGVDHVIVEYSKTAVLSKTYPRRFAKIKSDPL